MKHIRMIPAIAAAAALLAAGTLVGCSDDDEPGPVAPGGTQFDSGLMTAPATYVRTFPTAGTINYHCTPHGSMGMTGTVTVVAGAPDSALVTASGMVFTPSAVSVAPNGYVRWIVTGGTHTVTSD